MFGNINSIIIRAGFGHSRIYDWQGQHYGIWNNVQMYLGSVYTQSDTGFVNDRREDMIDIVTVSYTHLTLPTKRIV